MNSRIFKRLFLFPIVLVLVLVSTVSTTWGANLKVYIINVGQGDCELIVSPTGMTVLIDAGNNYKGKNVVIPYLDNLGITELDYIIASHYCADHIGGIDEVVEELGGISSITTAVYDRGGAPQDNTITFQDYVSAVEQKRTTITPGQVIYLGGGAKLTCIAVDGDTKNGTVYSGSDENQLSVVLKLDYLDFQMYFGGDSGQTIEGATASLAGNMDVYKVSHHGSDTASGQSFLDVIQPEISTIPVGNNSYDHPSADVHTRLVNIGSYIYQTETGNRPPPTGFGEVANGSFKIVTDGCSYTVSGSSLNTATYPTDCSNSSACNCNGDTGIVFSQVLYDSWVYYESEGEWLELYNPTSSTVNIGGWTIEDNSTTYTIPSGTTIASRGYLVIADGSSAFSQEYGCPPHLSNLTLRLNNDGDYLTLKNTGGTVMDQVAWESGGSDVSGWGSTSLPYANESKSIVRSNPDQDTDTYADWMSNQNPDPHVDGAPEIALSLTKLNFEGCTGGVPDTRTFSVSNSGCGTLNWSVTDNANWIDCSPTSGTNSGPVTVSVDSSGFAVGTYTGTITVTDSNATNSPQTVTVTLKVLDCTQPVIALTPTQLSFEAYQGSNPGSQTFLIDNIGSGTFNWSITDDADWLNCSPTSGMDMGEVTVTVSSSGLGPGDYTGTITVSAPNASNSPRTVAVTLTVLGNGGTPQISLNRTQLNFGACGGLVTSAQAILVSNAGDGSLDWTAATSTNWLTCSPSSGTDPGVVSISINTNRFELPVGTYTGFVTISDPIATNSPQTVTITLKIYSSDASPFGTFETPMHNSTVCSSIPVTGWVVDDVEIESVKIYRQDGTNLVYIGDAMLVEGARPDVDQAYPGYPRCYQAGWGYMMLTNFLPNQGNGTFIIYAKARDITGHETTLGTKTITCDNFSAVKPFGAIDTPGQGGTASGSSFINWGWVLTPQPNTIPTDGSTINVYVDGVKLGHPAYNIYRSDIASLFPGCANSSGAAGYFYLDTSVYENGVHTIQWTATDNAGNNDGIGSRYFTIQNTGGSAERTAQCAERNTADLNVNLSLVPGDYYSPILVKKGYNQNIKPHKRFPDENGNITIEIKELERIEIHLLEETKGLAPLVVTPLSGTGESSNRHWKGLHVIGNQLRPLPIGSFLDAEKGIFYWQPGVGFLGEYKFVFMEKQAQQWIRKDIIVKIGPKF